MSPSPDAPLLGRRGLLLGAGALGAGAAAHRLHQQQRERRRPRAPRPAPTPAAAATTTPGKAVTIGFSAPAADHGWIAAITDERQEPRPRSTPTSTLQAAEGTNDVNQQISQVETLINDKVDAIVHPALRRHGADRDRAQGAWTPASRSSTSTASSTTRSPSAHLDRRRQLRHGRRGRHLHLRRSSRHKGVTTRSIAEIAGIDSCR